VYDEARPFYDGLAQVGINGKYGLRGFIDKTGKMVIPAQYAEVTNFHDGVAAVSLKKTWQLIDHTGRPIINREFDAPTVFSEGLAPAWLTRRSVTWT